MTNVYELVLLYSPEAQEADLTKQGDMITGLVKKASGKVVSSSIWGRRPLAYSIQNFTEANYVFYELELDPAKLAVFDQGIRLNSGALRYLLVKQEVKKQTESNGESTAETEEETAQEA